MNPRHTTISADERPIRPEFIRLPKDGQLCPYTGLCRSAMRKLIEGQNPPVKSFVLRQRGKQRGTRLVVYDSLSEFLRNQMEAAQ